jgi:hypothetical protein
LDLQQFGAQTFHIVWYFATRVHLGLVYGCFGVYLIRVGLGSRSGEAGKSRKAKSREAETQKSKNEEKHKSKKHAQNGKPSNSKK